MRIVLAVLILAHAVAHLPGFLADWRLRAFPEMPFRTTVLGGLVDIGEVGIKIVGVAWLAISLAFMAVAIAALTRAAWWPRYAYVSMGISAILCLIQWPDARIGLLANAIILVFISVVGRAGWL